jgi:hypothetical protein
MEGDEDCFGIAIAAGGSSDCGAMEGDGNGVHTSVNAARMSACATREVGYFRKQAVDFGEGEFLEVDMSFSLGNGLRAAIVIFVTGEAAAGVSGGVGDPGAAVREVGNGALIT